MNKVNNEIELLDIEKVKKVCDERKEADISSLSEKESFELVMPIFKDYLKAFMNSIGVRFNFEGDEKLEGKIKYYSMCAIVNGIPDALLLKLDISDDSYRVNVRSISKDVPNSTVKMIFNGDQVDLEAAVVFRNTRNETQIDTVNDPAYKVESFCDGRKVLNKELSHEELQNSKKEEKGNAKRMKMNS